MWHYSLNRDLEHLEKSTHTTMTKVSLVESQLQRVQDIILFFDHVNLKTWEFTFFSLTCSKILRNARSTETDTERRIRKCVRSAEADTKRRTGKREFHCHQSTLLLVSLSENSFVAYQNSLLLLDYPIALGSFSLI